MYGRLVPSLTTNGNSNLRTHWVCFFQRLFENVHFYASVFRRGQKYVLYLSDSKVNMGRSDGRKPLWWAVLCQGFSDSSHILALNSIWGNGKFRPVVNILQTVRPSVLQTMPHGTSLQESDEGASIPMPSTSFYLTQTQWPAWLVSSSCSLSILNEWNGGTVWTGDHRERWWWYMVIMNESDKCFCQILFLNFMHTWVPKCTHAVYRPEECWLPWNWN